MVIRVTTKDGAKHKVLLNLNTKKREAHEEEIPKVFDYTSDSDHSKFVPNPRPAGGQATQALRVQV